MKKSFRNAVIVTTLAICLGTSGAWAKDAIKASVVAEGFTFTENGNPLSSGTYAIGTLKIFMIISATQWPESLSPIELNLAVEERKTTPATKYPVPILLRQAGGDLNLTPVPAEFDVDGPSWMDSSIINILVPQEIRDNPSLNDDGVELVGNLQIEPTTTTSHLDTVTTVKIIAKLVHPTACLRTVSFITDNGKTANLSADPNGITINYKLHNSAIQIQQLDPPQTLFNTLVVNSCADPKTFVLDLDVDPGFAVPANGQPVKMYISANAASTEGALIDAFAEVQTADWDDAIPLGTNLCVPSNTLNGMYSMWVSVDVELITRGFTSALPPVGTEYDGFMAKVLTSTSSCDDAGVPHPDSEGYATTSVNIKALSCSGQNCPAP